MDPNGDTPSCSRLESVHPPIMRNQRWLLRTGACNLMEMSPLLGPHVQFPRHAERIGPRNVEAGEGRLEISQYQTTVNWERLLSQRCSERPQDHRPRESSLDLQIIGPHDGAPEAPSLENLLCT